MRDQEFSVIVSKKPADSLYFGIVSPAFSLGPSNTNPPIITSLDCAWAAGLIDGEGCIHIRRLLATSISKNRSDYYELVLKVGMCDKNAIMRLQSIFGVGSVYKYKYGNTRSNDAFAWVCRSREAEYVLLVVHHFLVTKHMEATAALRFSRIPSTRGCKLGTPPSVVARRHWYYGLLRSMKSRYRFYKTPGGSYAA